MSSIVGYQISVGELLGSGKQAHTLELGATKHVTISLPFLPNF